MSPERLLECVALERTADRLHMDGIAQAMQDLIAEVERLQAMEARIPHLVRIEELSSTGHLYLVGDLE